MNASQIHGLTMNTESAAFVLGTTSTYTTTVTTKAVINGKFGTTLGAQTNTASPTLDAATGVAFEPMTQNKATVVVVGVNAAGAIKYCQGGVEDTETGVTTTVGAFKRPPQFPKLPADFCPLAYFLIRTAPSAAAFTVGTTSWTASGVTCSTPANVATLPATPQTA